jgi:photosystem II stability/assembly factor-like uncharacterized protein
VTFVSPDEGFVLGAAACSCGEVARTTDAGHTWSLIGHVGAAIAQFPVQPDTATGISSIRFADPQHGWVFGPELWSTNDGGQTWQKVALPSGVVGSVDALEVARGKVHAVVFDTKKLAFRMMDSAVGSGTWTVAGVTLPVGAGPVPEAQLVIQGEGGWVIQNDRTVVNGARLVNGTWEEWTPICGDTVGPAFLAAASATDIDASCDVGQWSTPQGTHIYASTDAGTTATKIGAKVPVQSTGAVATPDGNTIVVAGSTGAGTVLEGSFDRAAAWTQVLDLGDIQPVDLGFTTQTQGVIVAVKPSGGTNALYMTRDGGHTWSKVSF